MQLRSVREAQVSSKRVLVTAELNLARSPSGRVLDDSRLQAVLPTLRWLRRSQAKILIATHLGRPNGRVVESLRTKPLARRLSRALGVRVMPLRESVGPSVKPVVERMKPGQVILLENTRFHRGDEANDPHYARRLAELADLFVLESFGTAHRAHASIVGVGAYLPSYAGLQLVKEVEVLSRVLKHPRRPLAVLLGGSKISTKIELISALLPRVDALLLGGALANTILRAQGLQIGRSLNEPAMVRKVRRLKLTNPKFHIPVDVVVSAPPVAPRVRAVGGVQHQESILDIGPDTIALYASVLDAARTIVWNGPMGKYEHPPFDRGTRALAQVVAGSRAYKVLGGGETVDAVRAEGCLKNIDFISTGGGAMIEFLQGRRLPGLELVRR